MKKTKRCLAWIIAVLSVFIATIVYADSGKIDVSDPGEDINSIRGDVNLDGKIDDADVAFLLEIVSLPDDGRYLIRQYCDFNEDGVTDRNDAKYLLMYIYFPEEYPIPDYVTDTNELPPDVIIP